MIAVSWLLPFSEGLHLPPPVSLPPLSEIGDQRTPPLVLIASSRLFSASPLTSADVYSAAAESDTQLTSYTPQAEGIVNFTHTAERFVENAISARVVSSLLYQACAG